jgi:hypothetical protein
MTVYIVVLAVPYEGDDIQEVFDSEEAADQYIADRTYTYSCLRIRQYEVRRYAAKV